MTQLRWWQQATFYQIYPRSFADGNGDGIGDFSGIIAKLDYLKSLNVDALWLSPHFRSPNADMGYDVSDYTDIGPEYGTMADFRRFLDEAHARGLRVVLDLVLNHTSDQHPWFIESRASRHSPKRDWYIWRDPAPDGGPPNNWCSAFGGSAWEYDPHTGQYYYHFFFKQQPDLNWRNPEVKQAMWQVVRFWLDQGVDGFRLDAIGTIFEHPDYPDHQSDLSQIDMLRVWRENRSPEAQQALMVKFNKMFEHQFGQPDVHLLMKELRALMDTYLGDRVLIGEDDDIAYYGNGEDELHLVFNFPLMRTNRITPAWVRANQAERLRSLPPGAWPCNVLGNHDVSRMRSAFGDGQHDEEIARVNAALLLTLRDTPVIYNGEEIGMTDLNLRALRATARQPGGQSVPPGHQRRHFPGRSDADGSAHHARSLSHAHAVGQCPERRLQPARCADLAAGESELRSGHQRGRAGRRSALDAELLSPPAGRAQAHAGAARRRL